MGFVQSIGSDEICALGIQEAIKEANDIRDRMKQTSREMASWKFQQKAVRNAWIEPLRSLLTEYNTALAGMVDFHMCLNTSQDIEDEASLAQAAEVKKLRDRLYRKCARLMPESVAKVLSGYLSVGGSLPRLLNPASKEFASAGDESWKHTRVFGIDETVAATPHHSGIRDLYGKLEQPLQAAFLACVEHCVQKSHGFTATVLPDSVYHGTGKDPKLGQDSLLGIVVAVSLHNGYAEYPVYPLVGAPSLVTCTVSRCFVITVTLEHVKAEGNLRSFLKSKEAVNVLQRAPAFFLKPGMSVFVPCGSVPFIIALQDDMDSRLDQGHGSYMIHYLLDPEQVLFGVIDRTMNLFMFLIFYFYFKCLLVVLFRFLFLAVVINIIIFFIIFYFIFIYFQTLLFFISIEAG